MKKLLKWIAALVVLTALLCVPAHAATLEFSDSSRIEHSGAVAMLCDLGIISGYDDGTFRPTGTLSRQAAAQMIAQMMTGTPRASARARFSDVPAESKFAQAIAFCAEQGIISGSGGAFRPNDAVTPRALAKMLLGALGYDTSRYVGAGWGARVDEDAAALGIYDGFYDYYDQPISRDNACLLMFNALECYAVRAYSASGEPEYYLDELMNPQTWLEYRYGVVRYAELLVANEYADLMTDGGRLEEGLSQLEHHRAFAVSTGLEMIGRNVVFYVRDGEVVGVPTYSPYEGYYTFDSFIDLAQVLERVGMTIDSRTAFYYNYDTSDRLAMVRTGENDQITIIDHTGDGVIDLVLVLSYREAEVVSVEDGAVTARIDASDPFPVVTDGRALSEGDRIDIAWIGGRWLMKAE